MSDRVSTFPSLPTDMDAELRRALMRVFQEHARQINWATGDDVAGTITTSGPIAYDIAPADASGGEVALTLPPAADWRDRTMKVKKLDSSGNLVKIVPQSGETLDGTATVAISVQYTCLQVMSTGTEWIIV
jgi:hypothetical protein